jgi:hypothetical protein
MRRAWLLALALASCATSGAQHVVTGAERPAYAGEVRVFMREDFYDGDIEELAFIQATGADVYVSWWKLSDAVPNALEALRERARELGCNAVVNVDVFYDESRLSGTDAYVFGTCAYAPALL